MKGEDTPISDVIFLIIYYFITIMLSSLITYKVRYHLCKQLNLSPPKKMRWQAILAMFLLQIFTLIITFAILHFYDSFGNCTEIAVSTCMCLSILLAILYTIYYFINNNLYDAFDFIIMIIPTMFLNTLLYHMGLFTEIFFDTWCSSSYTVYMMFIGVFYIVFFIVEFIFHNFPNSREMIKQMWKCGTAIRNINLDFSYSLYYTT